MRLALYFAPDRAHPLAQAAAAWLGRDTFTGEALPQPPTNDFPGQDIGRITAEPRRYGFHGTLVAPFRLTPGRTAEDLSAETDLFAASREPFALQLAVARLGRFVALVPSTASRDMDSLAADAVEYFRSWRAPLTPQEIARRRPDELTTRQRAYLDHYGYPYVRDEFRFHMTLTGPLDEAKTLQLEDHLTRRFAHLIEDPVPVEAVALFVEPAPGAPFTVHSIHRFATASAGSTARRSA